MVMIGLARVIYDGIIDNSNNSNHYNNCDKNDGRERLTPPPSKKKSYWKTLDTYFEILDLRSYTKRVDKGQKDLKTIFCHFTKTLENFAIFQVMILITGQ